jgi:DNA invertase Pin-like site-specific DNA recombinase
MAKKLRAGLYARVSTTGQTVENQLRDLRAVARRHGWEVAATFKDQAISGARGREKRPGLDKLLQAVARREVDLVAAWSVDRLGRSLQGLLGVLGELHAKSCELYLHQQGIDTRTPAGKALFQMMGVFAEFERAIIVERVKSGLQRAKAQGKRLGRPRKDDPALVAEIERLRAEGMGINRVARTLGVGSSYVQRIIRSNKRNYLDRKLTESALPMPSGRPRIRERS